MKKGIWMYLSMSILVAGLLFTISCGKKTVLSDDTQIQNQAAIEAEKKVREEAERKAREEAEAKIIAEQKLQEQLEAEKAAKEAKIRELRARFENMDVYFEYDSSELRPEARTVLKEKAAWLKENYSSSVSIEGHCDERGTTEYNLALGERRANAAKTYLINLGISASRLNTISYGEEKPVDSGKNESAYQKNRRAHFVIE